MHRVLDFQVIFLCHLLFQVDLRFQIPLSSDIIIHVTQLLIVLLILFVIWVGLLRGHTDQTFMIINVVIYVKKLPRTLLHFVKSGFTKRYFFSEYLIRVLGFGDEGVAQFQDSIAVLADFFRECVVNKNLEMNKWMRIRKGL